MQNKNLKIMNTMTLNVDVPTGLNIDMNRLTAVATEYVQQYIYMLQRTYQAKTEKKKSTAAFRNMRGSLSSDLPYKDMIEEALLEKYEI